MNQITTTSNEREAERSAKADSSPVAADPVRIPVSAAAPRWENNQSDARFLAEDAADLCRRHTRFGGENGAAWTSEGIALAQAKALASIALSLAFGDGVRCN